MTIARHANSLKIKIKWFLNYCIFMTSIKLSMNFHFASRYFLNVPVTMAYNFFKCYFSCLYALK